MLHKNSVVEDRGKYEGERLLVRLLHERRICEREVDKYSYTLREYRLGDEKIVLKDDSLGVYEVENVEEGLFDSPDEYEEPGDDESDEGVCSHDIGVDEHCHECNECVYAVDEDGEILRDRWGDHVLECEV